MCVSTERCSVCVEMRVFSFFSSSHVGCYRGCYGIYSAVARTLPLNISSLPSHWSAAMMQDSLTPNLSRAPIETCQPALLLLFPVFCLSIKPLFLVSSATCLFTSLAYRATYRWRTLKGLVLALASPLASHSKDTHLTVCLTYGDSSDWEWKIGA